MTKARIVACKCPNCKGTGLCPLLDWRCDWCKGAKRLRKVEALRYADTSYMLGGGGYIAGDLDWNDKVRMEKEANDIYQLFGTKPPWSTTQERRKNV